MAKQFVFFYFMKKDAQRIRKIVPAHIRYWAAQEPIRHKGGPFADRSGGMILFEAADRKRAEKLAHHDPFVRERVVESSWVKEWMPEK